MQKSSRLGGIIWLSVYIGLLAGIAVGMFLARDKLVANSRRDQPSWTKFKQDTAEKARTKRGPVEHSIPPSDEPPMLVLLRDHFPMMFVAAIVFPAIILGFLMLSLRGAMRKPDKPKNDAEKKSKQPQPDEEKQPEMNANERESKPEEAPRDEANPGEVKQDDANRSA